MTDRKSCRKDGSCSDKKLNNVKSSKRKDNIDTTSIGNHKMSHFTIVILIIGSIGIFGYIYASTFMPKSLAPYGKQISMAQMLISFLTFIYSIIKRK